MRGYRDGTIDDYLRRQERWRKELEVEERMSEKYAEYLTQVMIAQHGGTAKYVAPRWWEFWK